MRVMFCLLAAVVLHADDQTNKMTARVSEEAEAFLKIAPEVLGTEALHQAAVKPPGRFHPRVGAAANAAPVVQWKERDLVSEYGFAVFSGNAIHELRQVISVDGRKIAETKKAQEDLAKAITASDESRKKEVLKQFEKYGLVGAVTDFGQILLLFTRREIERYEFSFKGSRMIGYDRALVFSYKQLDGPDALTVFDEKKNDEAHHLKVEGEIRVRASDFVPLQITLAAHQGEGAGALREEAAVTYKMSDFGGKAIAENRFTYTDFHKFGASSKLKFEAK
jgi:hypothetical protein